MPSLSSLPRHFRIDHRLSLCSLRFHLRGIVFSVFICHLHVPDFVTSWHLREDHLFFVGMVSSSSSIRSRRLRHNEIVYFVVVKSSLTRISHFCKMCSLPNIFHPRRCLWSLDYKGSHQ